MVFNGFGVDEAPLYTAYQLTSMKIIQIRGSQSYLPFRHKLLYFKEERLTPNPMSLLVGVDNTRNINGMM
jgi:hypothetical protein